MAEPELAVRAVEARTPLAPLRERGQLQEDGAMHITMHHTHSGGEVIPPLSPGPGYLPQERVTDGDSGSVGTDQAGEPRARQGAPRGRSRSLPTYLIFEPEGPVMSPEGRDQGSCPAPT